MLDSCRLHTDNDHANDVAADPEEARVEACPSTEYTKDASKRATHRAPLTPQYHGKHTVRPFRQAPKKSPNRNRLKQTSQSYTRKSEGVSQQENRTPESPTACDTVRCDHETACTRPPQWTVPLVWLCQQGELYDAFLVPGVKLTDATTARLSGGMALLVRKELSRFVDQIHTEYDNFIIWKLSKEILGSESEVVLLGSYTPPANSVLQRNRNY